MARKSYSEEFRRDAVELYRSTPGATVSGIAADIGLSGTTLAAWLKAAGVPVGGRGRRPGDRSGGSPPGPASPAEEVARLRVRVVELEAERHKLSTERDILRAAAKYFAGETRW